MSRHNSAPTHGWIISSQLTKWLSMLFIIQLLVLFIAFWTIRYSLNKDCTNLYKRDVKVLGYWWHVQAGSTKPGCPAQ